MIKIKPFKGVRPENGIAPNFVTRSIDIYTKEEFELKQNDNANFLQMIAPIQDKRLSTKQRFEQVRSIYDRYKKQSTLKKDLNQSLYIYKQEHEFHSFTGVLTGISADNYFNGDIKVHESTLKRREKNFTKTLNAIQFQAEPVLLTYEKNNKLKQLISIEVQRTPQMLFTTKSDGVRHHLWMVKDRLILHQFIETFKKMNKLYVADGHHRIASSVANVTLQRKVQKNWIGNESFNFILSYLIPNEELIIHDYNRLVTDLNGHTKEEFLKLIKKSFIVEKKGEMPYVPTQKHHISMYLEGEFYALFLSHGLRALNKMSILDTYQLEQTILKPILNIKNTRSDKRIGFVCGDSGEEGLKRMKAKIDSSEFKIGFGMYPVSVIDLQEIADNGLKMPPKSTYILPKVRGGLLILELDD